MVPFFHKIFFVLWDFHLIAEMFNPNLDFCSILAARCLCNTEDQKLSYYGGKGACSLVLKTNDPNKTPL